ncbi:hypothetical protein ACFWR9_35465 [Streptomyces sp. NPDC058534]|uniref:hypothetical protein n=1 Tax=Streptomyces sp. NPDC058534 TaxID=3346541 RepID=UPI00365E6C6C
MRGSMRDRTDDENESVEPETGEEETFEPDWDDEDEAADPAADTSVDRTGDPDVLLDVAQLRVEEINLHVEDLQARVSLRAEVLDLLKLNVGADVSLGRVELDIKGVEAQALLKVRLDNVAEIVGRVLSTIDRNPRILEQLASGLDSAAESLGSGAGKAAGELREGVGEAVREVGEGAGEVVEEAHGTAAEAGRRVSGQGPGDVPRATGRTAKETSSEPRRDSGSGRTVQRGKAARSRERQQNRPP